jgi:hypothetical protein
MFYVRRWVLHASCAPSLAFSSVRFLWIRFCVETESAFVAAGGREQMGDDIRSDFFFRARPTLTQHVERVNQGPLRLPFHAITESWV